LAQAAKTAATRTFFFMIFPFKLKDCGEWLWIDFLNPQSTKHIVCHKIIYINNNILDGKIAGHGAQCPNSVRLHPAIALLSHDLYVVDEFL
jgi:hypothetical protein